MARETGLLAVLGAAAAFSFLGGFTARSATADGGWDDPRSDRLKAHVAAVEAARRGEVPTTRPSAADPFGVDLRHGDVRVAGEVARVDVTLDVENPGDAPEEWRRTIALDPNAEVIGAALERPGAETVACRTLPFEDARRIDAEARGWRRPRRELPIPWPRRDPLRLERQTDDRLAVVVWPVAPKERVRIHLELVTPLRGSGADRTYLDPIRGLLPAGAAGTPPAGPEQGQAPRLAGPLLAPVETVLVVHPAGLSYATASPDMIEAGGAADALLFLGGADLATGMMAPARISFTVPRGEREAIAVRGGGFGTRVALWRFDPSAFLQSVGVEATEDVRLHLVPCPGGVQRISPDTFEAMDDASAVAARVSPGADALRYVVEVTRGDGRVDSVPVEATLRRTTLDEPLEDAIAAWHRARFVRRGLTWAGTSASRRAAVLRFAVDSGVLVPGTAALAVPDAERRSLPGASRRQYSTDGIELGGDADWASPPAEMR